MFNLTVMAAPVPRFHFERRRQLPDSPAGIHRKHDTGDESFKRISGQCRVDVRRNSRYDLRVLSESCKRAQRDDGRSQQFGAPWFLQSEGFGHVSKSVGAGVYRGAGYASSFISVG